MPGWKSLEDELNRNDEKPRKSLDDDLCFQERIAIMMEPERERENVAGVMAKGCLGVAMIVLSLPFAGVAFLILWLLLTGGK